MTKLNKVSGRDFDSKVLNNRKPVLVDFYADWCGPCNIQTPILEAVAADYKDKIDIVKVDVDQDKDLLAKYGIRSIPTLILFNEGKNVQTRVGVSNKAEVNSLISSVA